MHVQGRRWLALHAAAAPVRVPPTCEGPSQDAHTRVPSRKQTALACAFMCSPRQACTPSCSRRLPPAPVGTCPQVKVVRDLRYIFTRGDLFVDPTGSEIRWHKQHRATARSQAAAAAGTRGFLFAQSPDLFGSQGRGGRLGAGAHHSHRHHHQHHHHGGVGMSSSIPGASGGSGNSGSSGSGNSGGSPTRWLPGVYAAPASALRSCVTGACMSNSSTEAVAGEVDDGGLNLASLEECQEWSTACDGYLAGAQAQALRERGAGSHLFGSTYPGPLLPCAEEGHEA